MAFLSSVIYGFAWVCLTIGAGCLIALPIYMHIEKLDEHRKRIATAVKSEKSSLLMQKSA